MILTKESRAKAAQTRVATQAAKDAERAAAEQTRADELALVLREFPVKCSVQINCPKDKARHLKYGKVVSHNDSVPGRIEIGVRVNVENPKHPMKVLKEGQHPGISAWYLHEELIRALPPKD